MFPKSQGRCSAPAPAALVLGVAQASDLGGPGSGWGLLALSCASSWGPRPLPSRKARWQPGGWGPGRPDTPLPATSLLHGELHAHPIVRAWTKQRFQGTSTHLIISMKSPLLPSPAPSPAITIQLSLSVCSVPGAILST